MNRIARWKSLQAYLSPQFGRLEICGTSIVSRKARCFSGASLDYFSYIAGIQVPQGRCL